MADNTDDWMNPPPRLPYVYKDDRKEKPFLIEREGRAHWPPGKTEWREWERFATAQERDDALKALRKEHPAWSLRAEHYRPWIAFG